MNFISQFFSPPPAQAELKDPNTCKSEYTYWRARILLGSFVGYALYYFTRGTLAISMPQLKEAGYDEAYLGLLITVFQLVYGLSKFINGMLADRANPRYFMAFGLLMTGVGTIGFGLSGSITCFVLFWGINAWFQGCGSAPCHRLLTHWYSRSERGRWWSFWNTSHNVGAALLPIMAALLLEHYGWESVMIVPGVIAILGSFFVAYTLRDTPQSLGLPSIEEFKHDYAPGQSSTTVEKELSYREILQTHVLGNPWMWVLALGSLMVYLVRWTIAHWAFYFLVNFQSYAVWDAAKCIWWYEIGGFVGGIAAGWISDVIFKGRRAIVNMIYFAGLIPSVYFFTSASTSVSGLVLTQILMFAMGFFVFGPQMLLCVHAAEISHKKASATAVGFLGIIAYFGSALTGGPVGYMVKNGGWEQVFTLLEGFALCGLLSMLFMVIFFRAKKAS